MPLNPIVPGLRPPVRLRLDSKQPAKPQLVVAPGDELEVSADLADQLIAADPHFKPVGTPSPESEPDPESEAAGDGTDAQKRTRAKKA